MIDNKKSGGNTLAHIVLTGIMFLVGAQILDLSLVDMATTIEQWLMQFIG